MTGGKQAGRRIEIWAVDFVHNRLAKGRKIRILNHGGNRKGDMTDGVYNRYEYDAEKRVALELWADALVGIIGGSTAEIDRYHVRLSRYEGVDTITLG